MNDFLEGRPLRLRTPRQALEDTRNELKVFQKKLENWRKRFPVFNDAWDLVEMAIVDIFAATELEQ